MRCAVFARSILGKLLFDLLQYTRIQSGVELTAYFDLIENSNTTSYRLHHDVNQIHAELTLDMNKVATIELNPDKCDKFYIIGADFELREQLFKAGIDYKKISMCYGDITQCHCPLDEIFVIPKDAPKVSFKKEPATIYRHYVGETAKAHDRREREGFFEKYCRGVGIDIGYGADLIVPGCSGWDFQNGDAQYLAGIADESFDFVYSSHCLEHMYAVRIALQNWFRVVRKGGYLLLAIPHRDLYEKKSQLPSRWNGDHKHMFLIGRSEPPDTLDIMEEIKCALNGYDIKYIKACDAGHTITDPLVHSDGEYQIEIVIQKIG